MTGSSDPPAGSGSERTRQETNFRLKDALTALRESEATLRSLLQAAPVAVGLVTNRVFGWTNQQMTALTGYTSEELMGQDARMVYPSEEEYRRVGREKHADVERAGVGHVETVWRRKDGRDVEILLSSAAVVPGDMGKGLVFTAMDVSDLRRTEHQLKLTQFAMDSLGDASYWMVEDGSFHYVNDAACRTLGYTREELLGMSVFDIDPAYPRENWAEDWERLRREGPPTLETIHRRKDGTGIPVEIRAHYVCFQGEEYNIAFARDITERKALEDQLRQAQKMEAIGQLAGGVAHDFNNQLTVIAGYSDLVIARLPEDDPSRLALGEILRAGHRAKQLTSQLLAFSRKQVLRPVLLDVGEVMEEMAGALSRVLEEPVRLRIRREPDLARAKLDRSQLEQAVINLVVNARDAMMSGGGEITIAAANVTLDAAYVRQNVGSCEGPHVRILVQDTGHGMDDAVLEHVFDPFFTTKDVDQGTGLGLSMVYGFVRQSGGSITVESEPGRGTTFRLLFPVAGVETGRTVEAADPRHAPGGSERVLVVEDEEAVRGLMVEILGAHGYEVIESGDPNAALDLCDGSPPDDPPVDLLVTDVVMPGMNGPELATRIRERCPDLRVLFVSGYARQWAERIGGVPPGSHLLRKPFRTGDLAATVREVLDEPAGEASEGRVSPGPGVS